MKKHFLRFFCLVFIILLTLTPVYAEGYIEGFVQDKALEVWGGFGKRDNVYSCAETDEKVIALTFDDGPHPKYTDEILDILAKYNVKATFFVIGKNAELYPSQLKRATKEGHEIGNHTYSHMVAKAASKNELKDELEKTHGIIEKITGKAPVLFRPPTGYCNSLAVKSAAEMDYKIIVWTIDTRDWSHTNEKNIVKNVKNQVSNGAIILFHDYISSQSPTPDALREIIPYFLSLGYRFVTVSELLSYDSN